MLKMRKLNRNNLTQIKFCLHRQINLMMRDFQSAVMGCALGELRTRTTTTMARKAREKAKEKAAGAREEEVDTGTKNLIMAPDTEQDLTKGTQKGERPRKMAKGKDVVDLRERRGRKRQAQICKNALKMIMMHYLDIRGKRQLPENATNFEKCNITSTYFHTTAFWKIIHSSLNMLNI